MRPLGYFADSYTEEEVEQANQFAKKSVIRPPDDLE